MISLFDLDQTLLSTNGSYAFGCYLFRKKVISLPAMLYCAACYGLHKMGGLSLPATHEKIFRNLFQGRSHAIFTQLAREFVKDNIHKMIYTPALNKLREVQQFGHYIVLLSSSPAFLVRLIAEHLGIKEYHATEYELDKQGNFVSIRNVLDGQGKAQFLQDLINRSGIPIDKVSAYTDSHLDLPLLYQAGNAIGVNPDYKLRAICKKNGWDIIE